MIFQKILANRSILVHVIYSSIVCILGVALILSHKKTYLRRQGDLSSNDIQRGGYDLSTKNLQESCKKLCDEDDECFAFMINEKIGKCWTKRLRTNYEGAEHFSTYFKPK